MFHVEHWGPSPLLNMALSFTDYTLGDPITPNVNYKVAPGKAGDHAYLLTSSVAEATLQLTLTAPTDEEWSNVETWVANGPIAGRIFPLSANTYYFRVVGPPSLAYDSTLAIKDLDLVWPTDITPTAIPTDGTPITSGFYSLDALSLEVGKFHSFSIVPAKSGNLVGKHETSDQHRFVATIFGVNAQGFPVSHMTSFANTEQSIFNFDTAKAILHLSAPEGAEFNYTCSIASSSSGSGDSLTPSSDANITGAWSFTNITVPFPTQDGQAANKSYVDGQDWILQYQVEHKVDIEGNQTVNGVKTFTGGVTMADEAPLTFGIGADAVKFHGTGAGMSVIEGGTGAHLDVAVSTTFQEPTVFQDATTFSTMVKAEKGISFGITSGSSAMETLMEQNHPTLPAYGSKWTYTANNGYYQLVQRNNIVWVTFDPTGNVWFRKNFEVQGPATFTQGVTMGQTLTVAGLVTFTGDLAMAEDKLIYLSALVNMGAISGGSVSLNGSPTGKFNTNLAIETSGSITAAKKISANGGLESTGVTSLGGGLSDSTTVNGDLKVTSGATIQGGLSLPDGGTRATKASPVALDLLNKEMGDALYAAKTAVVSDALTQTTADARYGKLAGGNTWSGMQKFSSPPQVDDGSGTFKTALTIVVLQQATYDGLASKDDYTMYYVQDTSKVYLGTLALN